MAFTVPDFTRKQVSRAGSVLIDNTSSSEQKEAAMEILSHWRSCHAYPVNTFQATLRSRLKKVCNSPLVAQRLKRTPSILKKLQMNPGMQMARMQDIGGLRAVVENLSQVRKLQELYCSNNLAHQLIGIDDYIEQPKQSGYRSLHLIYKYKNPRNSIYDGLCIELQIRTKLQHAWATAVETIGTFLDQALKSSEGPQEWLDYFKLVGAAFALLEKSSTSAEYKNTPAEEIYKAVSERTKQLGVSQKLGSFAIAAHAIEKRQSQGNYHLVILNAEAKTVEIQSFGKKRLDEASLAYANAEQISATDKNIQAVLVATNSIDALKRAYPNYFLDTRQFSIELNKIQKLVENNIQKPIS